MTAQCSSQWRGRREWNQEIGRYLEAPKVRHCNLWSNLSVLSLVVIGYALRDEGDTGQVEKQGVPKTKRV